MKLTKEWFKKWNPCKEGVEWFLKNFKYGAEANDVIKALIKDDELQDANWAIVRCMKYEQYVKYAVYAAKQVLHIYEERYPEDKRPREAIKAAQRCIKDPSKKNKDAATYAADAAYAAYAYYAAARAAAAAATTAAYDYDAAATATATATADDAYAAAYAADAAYAAAAATATATATAAATAAADDAYAAAYAADDAYAAAYDYAAAADAAGKEMRLKILKYGLRIL